MAKMHSRARGTSGSKKPLTKTKPTWIRYSAKEIELLIVKLANEGMTPSQIGIILRDSYGVPDIKLIIEKNLTKVLEEKNLKPEIPEPLTALIKRAALIRKHLETHKHDEAARRGLLLTESKIHRISKYYKRTETIPNTWKYDREATTVVK
jgi:small subunit ribosomal protein S15